MDTPYSVIVLDEVTSTQDAARAEASTGRPVVVVAHRQTRGRGRSDSEWATAPRAVAVSAAWQWDWPTNRWSLIPLVAGVAARRVLGGATSLKWPNDVLLGEGKVAGILVESADDLVITGMGVNVHWPQPPTGAVGLHRIDHGEGVGPSLALEWARRLWELKRAGPDSWPRDEYLAACVTLGREVTWSPDGSGRATDIGPYGSLSVETADGRTVSLTAGAVQHVRSTGRPPTGRA